MTQSQNISRPGSTSIARLRICEGVGQGRSSLPYVPHALAQMLANSTLPPELVVVVVQPKPRRQRKPSIKRMIAAAERSGKTVTSLTTPDGVTLRFGESEPTEANNPWLAGIDDKVTKQ